MVAMSGAGWTLAPALKVLVEQLDNAYPTRSRVSDGSIGDARHQAENYSDHNPRRAASGIWYVTAVDISNAPWLDGWVLNQLTKDPRVKYLIRNRRYWQRIRWSGSDPVMTWVPYGGTNPHTHHVHISLQLGAATNTARWAMPGGTSPVQPVVRPPAAPKPAPFLLPKGHWYGVQDGHTAGAHAGTDPHDTDKIRAIQAALNRLGNHLGVDGKYGPATEAIVKVFQANRGLTADGKVGPVTWGRLF